GAVAVVPVGDGAGDVPVGVVEDVGEGGGADEPGCAGEEQVSHGGDGRHPTVKIIPLWWSARPPTGVVVRCRGLPCAARVAGSAGPGPRRGRARRVRLRGRGGVPARP